MEQEFVPLNQVHIACDTGLLWEIIKGNAPWLADFEAMARAGVVFSLADHALAEIINQIDEGRFTDAQYVSGIAEMARFISPDWPVLPGKKQLAEWCSDSPDQSELDEDRCQSKAQWKLMTTAKSIADFERGIQDQRLDGSRFEIRFTRGTAKLFLADERKNWVAHIDPPRPGWRSRPVADRLADLAGDLDTDVKCDPPLTVRLDAALRHEDRVIELRSDTNNPFNPHKEKSRNDGIDYNMSYVYMKRVLLCSQEITYTGFIRSLNSYQSAWIYRPDELVEAWKAGRLARPQWPNTQPPN